MQNDSQKGMLGSRFENFNAEPSPGLWDSISSGLDEKKKRRGIIWWWLGSGIAAIGLIAASIYSGQTSSAGLAKWNSTHESKIKREQLHPNFTASHSLIETDSLVNITNNQLNSGSSETTHLQPQKQKDTQDIIPIEDVLRANLDREEEVIKATQLKRVNLKKLEIAAPQLIALIESKSTLPPVDLTVKNKCHHWEIGFGLSSWQGVGSFGYKSFNEILVDSAAALDLMGGGSNVYTTNRPIGLAFHLGYHLNDRLRLVSGLSVESTQFKKVKNDAISADFFESTAGNFQSFSTYSIGVPIGVNYDFFKRNRLRFGVGLNLINEFVFAERIKPLYDANFVGPMSANNNFITGYNLGINPNLHVSYHLSEKIKIQATPGLRWYPISQAATTYDLPQRKFYWGGSVAMIWQL